MGMMVTSVCVCYVSSTLLLELNSISNTGTSPFSTIQRYSIIFSHNTTRPHTMLIVFVANHCNTAPRKTFYSLPIINEFQSANVMEFSPWFTRPTAHPWFRTPRQSEDAAWVSKYCEYAEFNTRQNKFTWAYDGTELHYTHIKTIQP